jgi:hypothetical protein
MKSDNEKGHLCFIIQGSDGRAGIEIMEFYLQNRYYPGLTGAVVFYEGHVMVVLEGEGKIIVEKFMELTESIKAFIEIISSGPLFDEQRTFNSWDLGHSITTGGKAEKQLVMEINQEDGSSLRKILNGESKNNKLTGFVRSFLMKGQESNYNKFWEGNS